MLYSFHSVFAYVMLDDIHYLLFVIRSFIDDMLSFLLFINLGPSRKPLEARVTEPVRPT